MIIEELHWAFDSEVDKLNNGHIYNLTDPEKDRLLNIAIKDYVEIFFNGTNPKQYRLGFEINKQRIEMLDSLIRETTLIRESNYFALPELSYVIDVDAKNLCGDELYVDIIKSSVHNNSEYVSNPLIGQLMLTRVNGKLKIKGEYPSSQLTRLGLTYLAIPNEVCLGTYEDISNIGSPQLKNKVECNLNERYHYLIPIMAAQEFYRINGDQRFALNEAKIQKVTT